MAAAKAGWKVEWLDSCLDWLTLKDLHAGTVKKAEEVAAIVIDGESMGTKATAAADVYSALVTTCQGRR